MRGPCTWKVLTADGLAHIGVGELVGVVVLASAAGGGGTLYDGLDTSGAVIGTFKGAANVSNAVILADPLPLSRGLYLGGTSNVTQVLVLFRPDFPAPALI